MKWISVKDNMPPKDIGNQLTPVAIKIARSGCHGERDISFTCPTGGIAVCEESRGKTTFAYYGYKVAGIPESICIEGIVYKMRWGFLDFNLQWIENVTHWLIVPLEDE